MPTESTLDSSDLAQFVTGKRNRGRLLYRNEGASIENNSVTILTGSNIEASMELVDRMVSINVEAPKTRNADLEFVFNPITQRILSDRGKYLGSVCKLVQDWLDNEQPESPHPAKHRQREWAKIVGDIMANAGLGKALLSNDADMRRKASPTEVTIGWCFLHIYAELGDSVFSPEGFGINDIFHICSHKDLDTSKDTDTDLEDGRYEGHNLLGEIVGDGKNERSRETILGIRLRKMVGSTYQGFRLVACEDNLNRKRMRFVDYRSDSLKESHKQDVANILKNLASPKRSKDKPEPSTPPDNSVYHEAHDETGQNPTADDVHFP